MNRFASALPLAALFASGARADVVGPPPPPPPAGADVALVIGGAWAAVAVAGLGVWVARRRSHRVTSQ